MEKYVKNFKEFTTLNENNSNKINLIELEKWLNDNHFEIEEIEKDFITIDPGVGYSGNMKISKDGSVETWTTFDNPFTSSINNNKDIFRVVSEFESWYEKQEQDEEYL